MEDPAIVRGWAMSNDRLRSPRVKRGVHDGVRGPRRLSYRFTDGVWGRAQHFGS